jgi:hypothetical protein
MAEAVLLRLPGQLDDAPRRGVGLKHDTEVHVSHQILRETALEERTVCLVADVAATVDDHAAA